MKGLKELPSSIACFNAKISVFIFSEILSRDLMVVSILSSLEFICSLLADSFVLLSEKSFLVSSHKLVQLLEELELVLLLLLGAILLLFPDVISLLNLIVYSDAYSCSFR